MTATERLPTAETGAPPPSGEAGHAGAAADPSEAPRRFPWRSSARLRIAAWFLLMLAVALGLSLLATWQLLLESLDERIDADLAQEVEELRSLADGVDPEDGRPFGDRVDRLFEVFLRRNIPAPDETMLAFVDGRPLLRSAGSPPVLLEQQPELVARWADLGSVDRGSVVLDEVGRVEFLAVPLRADDATAGVFVVAAFADLMRREVDEVMQVAGGVGLSALVLCSLLAWAVASRVLAPVRALTRTATTITETDLSRRIDVDGDDEVAELAATFNAMLDRLEHAFTTQRAFVSDAGHELRTPITIVRGHLELLEDDPVDRAETMALVMDELDRMNRMVEDLLLLAKAEQPDFLNLETVELGAFTDEAIAKVRALAPRRWVLELRGRGVVVADRQRLTQAVMQLAQNATQHTDEDDEIALGSAVEAGHARVWVRDTGSGVPLEDQDRIFERFRRGRDQRRRSEGAGLGLSIVRAIAEAHHGHLELVSQPGDGSTFTIVFPIDPLEEGAA